MESATPYRTLQPGDIVGSYRIERILGRGGFGVIYLAVDANLRNRVAVKEYIPGDIATRTSDSRVFPVTEEHGDMFRWGLDRFIKEARNLVKFRHPNIVRVTSLFQANNTAYMVMDFEEGEPLRSYVLRPTENSEEKLKALLLPVSEGLIEVHRQGFIHRDIKPSNILVRRNGTPVLIDFGSARHASKQLETKGLTALVSAGYAPLEQYNVESEEQQGPWSDIYALGGVLYYAITGRDPVDSTQRGSALFNGGKDPLIPASDMAKGDYSEPFLRAVDWALQVRIADRPQSVSDWVPALLAKELPPDAAQTTREYIHSQNLSFDTDLSTGTVRRGSSSRKRRSTKGLWAMVAGVALVLSGSLVVANYGFEPIKRYVVGTLGFADPTVGVSQSDDAQRLAEQAEADRLAKLEQQAEAERLAEQQRLQAEKVAEQERLAQEQALAEEKEQEAARAAEAEEQARLAQEAERKIQRDEQIRLAALEARRRMNLAISDASSALEDGNLDQASVDIERARSFGIYDARISALQTSLEQALEDRKRPVTDTEFERVVESFHALKEAIETKDVALMKSLTEDSNQNALFEQLMSRFASLDIAISGIRVRNIDRSIVGNLRIERMVRENGDLTTPSDTYRNRSIKSRRINGEWTLIEW
ncbi:MAG: protein kinase [Gammaproteobacteria bacterium]|nr:protein kinase [Gammaproteobacteria bacterium]